MKGEARTCPKGKKGKAKPDPKGRMGRFFFLIPVLITNSTNHDNNQNFIYYSKKEFPGPGRPGPAHKGRRRRPGPKETNGKARPSHKGKAEPGSTQE